MSIVMLSWMLKWEKEDFGLLKISLKGLKGILEKIGQIKIYSQL